MKQKTLSKIQGILLSITGVLSIVFGFVCNSSGFYSAYRAEKYTYGGDAYTGIQNAAAQTANNVDCLNSSLNGIAGRGFMFVLIIAGIVLIITGVFKILNANAEKESSASGYSYAPDYNPVQNNTQSAVQSDTSYTAPSQENSEPVANEIETRRDEEQ